MSEKEKPIKIVKNSDIGSIGYKQYLKDISPLKK